MKQSNVRIGTFKLAESKSILSFIHSCMNVINEAGGVILPPNPSCLRGTRDTKTSARLVEDLTQLQKHFLDTAKRCQSEENTSILTLSHSLSMHPLEQLLKVDEAFLWILFA